MKNIYSFFKNFFDIKIPLGKNASEPDAFVLDSQYPNHLILTATVGYAESAGSFVFGISLFSHSLYA